MSNTNSLFIPNNGASINLESYQIVRILKPPICVEQVPVNTSFYARLLLLRSKCCTDITYYFYRLKSMAVYYANNNIAFNSECLVVLMNLIWPMANLTVNNLELPSPIPMKLNEKLKLKVFSTVFHCISSFANLLALECVALINHEITDIFGTKM